MVNIKAGDSDHTFCITETDKRSFFLWPCETLLILLFVVLRYLLGRWRLTQPLVEAFCSEVKAGGALTSDKPNTYFCNPPSDWKDTKIIIILVHFENVSTEMCI